MDGGWYHSRWSQRKQKERIVTVVRWMIGLVNGSFHVNLRCCHRRHRRSAAAGPGGDSILIPDKCLRVQFEGFSHEFSDSTEIRERRETTVVVTYPHTTTSSSMLPHTRATVELSLDPCRSTESSSNRFRTLLYMASSSSVATSSSCSSR